MRVQRAHAERKPHQTLDLAVGPEAQEEADEEEHGQDHANQGCDLSSRILAADQACRRIGVVVARAVGDVAKLTVRSFEPSVPQSHNRK